MTGRQRRLPSSANQLTVSISPLASHQHQPLDVLKFNASKDKEKNALFSEDHHEKIALILRGERACRADYVCQEEKVGARQKEGVVFRGRELVCACLPPKRPASKTGRHQDLLAPV